MKQEMRMEQESNGARFTPLHVNAHGYDSPYLVKAFIEDESGRPVCGLYEGDGAYARLFAAAPALYGALTRIRNKVEAAALAGYEKTSSYDVELRDVESAARAALALVDGPQNQE